MRLFLFAVLAFSLSAHAFFPVNMKDSVAVDIDRGIMGTKYRQNGKLLKLGSVYGTVGEYSEAESDVAASKRWFYPGLVAGGVGGFLIGFPIGSSLGGGEFNAPMFYSGLGVLAVALVLSKVADNHLVKAVEKYNGVLGAPVSLDGGWSPEESRLVLRLNF
jgi:hypothetical protein